MQNNMVAVRQISFASSSKSFNNKSLDLGLVKLVRRSSLYLALCEGLLVNQQLHTEYDAKF
jgi:hypothetical protein